MTVDAVRDGRHLMMQETDGRPPATPRNDYPIDDATVAAIRASLNAPNALYRYIVNAERPIATRSEDRS